MRRSPAGPPPAPEGAAARGDLGGGRQRDAPQVGMDQGLAHACPQTAADWLAVSGPVGQRVMVSVRTFSHSRREKPLAAKKVRIRALFHPSTSSRTGTSTLSASSERI